MIPMPRVLTLPFTLCATFALMLATLPASHANESVPLDAGWRFHLGDVPNAEDPTLNDQGWRQLDLPHDWSIEGAPRPDAPSAGGGGFYPDGIGWYRKHLAADVAWRGQRVWIEFDGVYRDSDVWLNGHALGHRPSGYASFQYELTPWLRFEGDNVLAVRVDNSAEPNSRYYTGSGIYRHVRLRIEGPQFIDPQSVFVATTALNGTDAELRIDGRVISAGTAPEFQVDVSVSNDHGRIMGSGTASMLPPEIEGQSDASPGDTPAVRVRANVHVSGIHAWSPASPELYTVTLRLVAHGHELDRVAVPIGVRTVRVSADRGLELNGRPVKLFGCNLHDDNGPLGTAAFDRAEERRAELIKAAGFNAVRTAHNPPAPAFLSACDRLGLLVIDEAFDGWEKKKVSADYSRYFAAWSERDLGAMIRRDRNHPSVIAWSVGNEPYERTSASGAAIAKRLSAEVHALDDTRPVTAGINGPGKNGTWSMLDPLFAALDIAGYNYEIARAESDHARLPQRVMVQTESYLVDAFASWSAVATHPYVIGDFVWSGMDYLGEAGIGRVFPPDEPVRPHWVGSHVPWHGAACGDFDLIGERRPLSHYRAIVWDRGEKLYAAIQVPTFDGRGWNRSLWASPPLCASWTWPGLEGRGLSLEVYSRHAAVRVYLNGRIIGEKPTGVLEQFKAVFVVPYAPGELRVVGVDAGRETETYTLTTNGAPAGLQLHADRSTLSADGADLAFVRVSVADASGRTVVMATDPAPGDAAVPGAIGATVQSPLNEWEFEPAADKPPLAFPPAMNAEVLLEITGPAEIIAIGSADLTTLETYHDNPHRLYGGRALVVVRTHHRAGPITLEATAPGLKPATLRLTSTSP